MTRLSKLQNQTNHTLYTYLSKLNTAQFRIFYCLFVHYCVKYKYFISKQNLFNLRCELNQFCHELDESFPDQYDDFEEMRSFCKAHPYYIIDKLPINLLAHLFATYIDDRIYILTNIVKTLYEADARAAYVYANEALCLDESIDTLVSETHSHIKYYS